MFKIYHSIWAVGQLIGIYLIAASFIQDFSVWYGVHTFILSQIMWFPMDYEYMKLKNTNNEHQDILISQNKGSLK